MYSSPVLRSTTVRAGVGALLLMVFSSQILGQSPDGDPRGFVEHMLTANSPWLAPKPMKASYSLLTQLPSAPHPQVIVGPYGTDGTISFPDFAAEGPPSGSANRVGSIVWCCLHAMYYGLANYEATFAGTSVFGYAAGTYVAVIDIKFEQSVWSTVGMGGQVVNGGQTNYSGYSYPVDGARLFIATNKPIPVYIVEHFSSQGFGSRIWPDLTWQFDPNFYSLDGGYAPRSFEWVAPASYRLVQTFEITPSQDWMFQQGTSWDSFASGLPDNVECSMELTNLTMDTPLQFLSVGKSEGFLVLNWTSFGKSGITVTLESAPNLNGPWLPLVDTEATNLLAGMSASKPAQYYRLKKQSGD